MITEDIAVLTKAGAVSLTMVAVASANSINTISVPLIGVPLTALTMAAAGAMCAFAWPRAEASRSRLFGITLASTFVGASCVSVIPHAFGTAWPKELEAPLAFIFGLLAPWTIPAIRSLIPTFMQGLANLILRIVGAKAGLSDGNYTEPKSEGKRGKEVEREGGD